jgi:hypothetical protein
MWTYKEEVIRLEKEEVPGMRRDRKKISKQLWVRGFHVFAPNHHHHQPRTTRNGDITSSSHSFHIIRISSFCAQKGIVKEHNDEDSLWAGFNSRNQWWWWFQEKIQRKTRISLSLSFALLGLSYFLMKLRLKICFTFHVKWSMASRPVLGNLPASLLSPRSCSKFSYCIKDEWMNIFAMQKAGSSTLPSVWKCCGGGRDSNYTHFTPFHFS